MAGQSALVFGAGTIGLLVGLWLRHFGASRVVMADVRAESLELARTLGFEETLDVGKQAPSGPFDAVFEAAGSGRALASGIDRRATKALSPWSAGTRRTPSFLIRSSSASCERSFASWAAGATTWVVTRPCCTRLAGGSLPLDRMITHEVDLDGAPAP